MKKVRILSLLLAMALVLSILGGCAQNQPEPSQSAEPSQTQPEVPAEPEPEPETAAPSESQQPPQPSDITDDELTSEISEVASAERTVNLPLTEEKETLSIYMKQLNLRPPLSDIGLTVWNDFEFAKKLEEMTNVHIDYQEANFMTFMEQFNLYIAGGDWADMVLGLSGVYAGGNAKAFDDEVVVDLTPYIEEYAPNYYYYMTNVGTFSRDFKIDGGYVVDIKSFYDNYRRNNGSVIRQDWLDEQGLEVPTTYSQMTETLEIFKVEYGCDSPFYISQTATVDGFVGGFGVGPVTGTAAGAGLFQVDGQVKHSILEDGFLDYIALMQDWYQKGLISSDYTSLKYDPFSSDISNGVGSDNIAVWPSLYEEIESYAKYNTNPNFTVSPVPNLVKNEGDVEHISSRLVVDQDSMSITTQCSNVELAIKWMDFWYSDAGVLMLNYGVEGVTYEMVDGEPVFTDMVINNEFDITVSSFLRSQCPYGSFAGIYSPTRIEDHMTDLQLAAWDAWTNSGDGLYAMPSGLSLTALESEEASLIQSDVGTAIEENLNLFITGVKPMEEWDAFITQLKSLNIEGYTAIYQGALDRYYER